MVAAIIVGAIMWVSCARMCFCLAREKGYDTSNAAIVGFLFGMFALVYYAGLPLSQEKREKETEAIVNAIKSAAASQSSGSVPTASSAPEDSSFAAKADDSGPADSKHAPAQKLYSEGKPNSIVCSRCGTVQNADRLVCWQCGSPFTENSANQSEKEC